MRPEEAQPAGDADQAKAVTQTQHGAYRPTVKDMQNDSVAAFTDLWSGDREPEFDAAIVDRVFQDELLKNNFSVQKLTLLEVGQYLEKVGTVHHVYDITIDIFDLHERLFLICLALS